MNCDVIATKASDNPIGALKIVALKKYPALWGKNSRSSNTTVQWMWAVSRKDVKLKKAHFHGGRIQGRIQI